MNESTPAAIKPHQPNSAATAGWIAGVVVVICIAGFLTPAGWNFVAIVLALTVLLLVLGRAIVGRPLGALINEQNVMSLSRLQMALWTVIILAAYLAYAFVRIMARESNPLDIKIDWHLLALMGISATSFVRVAAHPGHEERQGAGSRGHRQNGLSGRRGSRDGRNQPPGHTVRQHGQDGRAADRPVSGRRIGQYDPSRSGKTPDVLFSH